MKRLFTASVFCLVVFAVYQLHTRQAKATYSTCTLQEKVHCDSVCVSNAGACYYVPPATCVFDFDSMHSLCGCDYLCMISPHVPNDNGRKHLEIVDLYN